MRTIIKLDINESIKRQRLIYQEKWYDKIDRIYIYLLFSFLVGMCVMFISNSDFSDSNEKSISLIISPIVIIIALYVIYRKVTEKCLNKIKTPFNEQKNRKTLLKLAEKQELQIYRKSQNCLIFNESYDNFNSSYKRSMIFILKDNLVLYTIIRDGYKLNMPTLISHILLKHDLKKIFKTQLNDNC